MSQGKDKLRKPSGKIMMRWNRGLKSLRGRFLLLTTCRSSTQSTWSTAQLIRMKWKRWGSLQLVDLVLSFHSYWALYIKLLYKQILLSYFMGFVGFIVLWSITHFVFVFCLTVWPILYACHVDGSQVHHGNRAPAEDCQWPSTAGLRWNRKWITNTHCTAQQ